MKHDTEGQGTTCEILVNEQPVTVERGRQPAADVQQAAVDQGVLNPEQTYVLSIETEPRVNEPRVTEPINDLIEVEPGICIVAVPDDDDS